MRKLFASALVVGLLTLIAANLSGAPDRTADLKKADQDWAASVAARNLDQFMGFVRDDSYMSGPEGKWMHGKDAIRAEWTKMLADQTFKLSWTVDSADVSKDGSLGYTRGTFQGGQGTAKFSGSYATVWQKDKDGKWRAQVDMATAAQ
jgi:ketosteroid isomerase-like protein